MHAMKHVVIYHAHCNDGFGAAWAVWKYLTKAAPNDAIILRAASYGTAQQPAPPPWDLIDKHTQVHIVDFSYAPEVMIELCAKALRVSWSDHHKTALDAWAEYCNYHDNIPVNLDTFLTSDHSGAMLAWKWYHHDEDPPVIISHIEDRDLWRFNLPMTKEVHLNLSTYPKDIHTWDNLIESCQDSENFLTFAAEGSAIDRYYKKLISDTLTTNKRKVWINGIEGLSCNCSNILASDLAHALANESGTFGYTWETLTDGTSKCSLRSNGDFDVSALAKLFGGGGHKNAAGFILNQDLRNSGLIIHEKHL